MSRSVYSAVLFAGLLAAAGPDSLAFQEGQPATPASSKVWVGRHAEVVEFLSTASIERLEAIPVGVTRPRRAFFSAGGMVGSAIVKTIGPGRFEGFWDSYKSEVAAYLLDRLLALDMVPPTVARGVDGRDASVQLWVEGTSSLKKLAGKPPPDIVAWNRQVYRQRVFDNLIGNVDRNEGNILVDAAWNVILIDHSRAFDGAERRVPHDMSHIDREFLDRLRALDSRALEPLSRFVDFSTGPTLWRRNLIVQHFDKLIRERGEAAVIVR